MGIYHNFDKLVKTHVNTVLQMSLCCFLTVSCPTNIILASYIKQQPEHRSDYDYYDWESLRNELLKPHEILTRRQKA